MQNLRRFFSSKSSNQKSGFTLIELAIVLVITGMILTAILEGQEMVDNGKVKSIANDLNGVSIAYYAYLERYKAIPGDDLRAPAHVSGGKAGNGDGIIRGAFTDANDPITSESNAFWQHTRLSGLLTGVATASKADPPNNAVQGQLGVQGGTTAALVYGMSGNVVCASSIPWKIAQAVDIMIDDGNSATGTLRAGAAGEANQSTATDPSEIYGSDIASPVDTGTLHTLCMKI